MAGARTRPASKRRGDARADDQQRDALVYAAVVDSALDAVIVVDELGHVVTLNAAAEATFGYTRSEALGRPIGALIVPDQHKQAHEAGLARYRTTGVPHVLGRRVEMEAQRKDGAIIPVELAITEVNLPDRRYFTANLRDLSAAKAAETVIERQRDALHQSEKLAAIGSLLAGVAHELNNPLSVVLGQAAMLVEELEGVAGEAARTRATQIRSAAERCARVVRSFMAIARQNKTDKRAAALAPLLDGAVELLGYGLKSNGVAVFRDYSAMPDVFVDPDQLQQIVVNLIVNANQALQEAEGRRAIEIRATVGGDGMARITVDDSGPGIQPSIAERIFDPFFTTKPTGVGTGIGLSISRGLAESQGGRLTLAASMLGGSAFELAVPLAAGEGAVAKSEAAEAATQAGAVPGTGPLRAIIIDDEQEIAALVAEALARRGYRCDLAASGAEAQALIAADGGYDAVLCDLRMPDMDGPALFRWITAHHPGLADRLLFVTGDALGPAAGRFLAECGRPYLEKPFAPADVARLVQEFPSRAR